MLILIRDMRGSVMSDWLTIAILSVADIVVLAAMAVITIAVFF